MKFVSVDMKFKDSKVNALLNVAEVTFIREMEGDTNACLVSFENAEPIVIYHALVDVLEMITKNPGGRPKKHHG